MKKIFQNPFLQGSMYLTAATFIIGIINYIFNIVAGRMLGPENYGNITALFAYLGVLTIPLSAISNVLIQRIGNREGSKEEYAWAIEQWTYTQLKQYWWLILLSLFLIPFVPSVTNISPIAAYTIIPLFYISILSALYDGIFAGLQHFLIISIIAVISVLIKLSGALSGYVVSEPFLYIVLFFSISNLVKVILNKYWLSLLQKKAILQKKELIQKTLWSICKNRQFLLTLGSIFSISLINNIDMIFAKKIFAAEAAGFYGAWALFAKVIIYIFAPLLTMSYIFFSSKKEGVHHHIVLILSLISLAILGVILNLAYGMYDVLLIKFLIGEKFLPIKPFVEWAALYGIGYVMVMFMNNYFLAKESKATLILPIMTVLYFPGLLLYGRELGSMILFTTVFMFAILLLYLLVFFKDRFIQLFQ